MFIARVKLNFIQLVRFFLINLQNSHLVKTNESENKSELLKK